VRESCPSGARAAGAQKHIEGSRSSKSSSRLGQLVNIDGQVKRPIEKPSSIEGRALGSSAKLAFVIPSERSLRARNLSAKKRFLALASNDRLKDE